MSTTEDDLQPLFRAIAARDFVKSSSLLVAIPALAQQAVHTGEYFLTGVSHQVYRGDTALHIAAASHLPDLVQALLAAGAHVGAKNRNGAQPLHYAADGNPESEFWSPANQVAVIERLVSAGADPNAADKRTVTPLHRAVRTRCAGAVRALLSCGANPRLVNKNNSTPLLLAVHNTGRAGTGSPAARAQQALIIGLLQGSNT